MQPELTGWRRLIFGPLAPRVAVALGVVVALPFCATGHFMDDYLHLALLDGFEGFATGDRWHLFTFASGVPEQTRPLIENGPFPWWTLPELKFSFVRPLTAVAANAEYALFGANAPLMHLHSIAWYAALIVAVNRLFSRALGTVSVAAPLACVLFAIDDAHTVTVGWVANRNALIAAVFGVLATLAHVRWREDGWRPGLPLSLVCAALGLSAGESAVGALAYLGAWEVTVGRGSLGRRAASLAPLALLGLAYLVFYKLSGSGAYGSEIYNDPLREPVAFLTRAPAKALALIGAGLLGATADLWMLMVPLRPVLVATGVVALVLVGAVTRALWRGLSEEERRGLRWLTLGALLSLVPLLATFPLNRLLLLPSIGGSALIAVVLVHGWRAATTWVRWGSRALVVPAVALCATAWPVNAGAYWMGAELQKRAALQPELSDEALTKHVFVFLAPDPSAVLYSSMVRQVNGKPAPKSWVTISFAAYPHKLTRLSEREVEVEVVGGRMMESVFEQLLRSSDLPLPVGYRARLAVAEVEVMGLDEGRPNRLKVTFDEPPDPRVVTLGRWDGDVLKPLELPPVGQSLLLPKPSGLLSL